MIAAVVPAAGRSQRMGRPKLLLPIDGEPLIVRVVTALREGGAERVVVVAPPAESEGGPAVAALASQAGGLRACAAGAAGRDARFVRDRPESTRGNEGPGPRAACTW